jgi:serine/threonine protein phosphatase PrpC
MTGQSSLPDELGDPIAVAVNYDPAAGRRQRPPANEAPTRPSPTPGHTRAPGVPAATLPPDFDLGSDGRWAIGDAGRAFTEVEPALGDSGEGPDTIADGGSMGSLHLVAASVRGLSHRQQGTPRQDSYGFAVSRDKKWLIAVVADGVSAGRLSHRAAQLVARLAPTRVLDQLEAVDDLVRVDWYRIFKGLATRILTVGQKLLAEEGDVVDPTPEDVCDAMATTATIAVVEISPLPDQSRYVTYAWLGDSPMWYLTKRDGWHCLTEVKNAGQDIAKSSVHALPRVPEDPAKLSQASTYIPADARLLLMTDGVGDPLGAADGEVAEVLAEVWRRPPSVFRFAEQVAFGRKTFDDDRTAVGIWPRPES